MSTGVEFVSSCMNFSGISLSQSGSRVNRLTFHANLSFRYSNVWNTKALKSTSFENCDTGSGRPFFHSFESPFIETLDNRSRMEMLIKAITAIVP